MAYDFPNVSFDWLGQLPQIREQAQAQEAIKGLGSLSLKSPEDLASAAQKAFASGNAQVGIQLLSAANQQRAAQQRAANMDINSALLGLALGGGISGAGTEQPIGPTLQTGKVPEFTYNPDAAAPQQAPPVQAPSSAAPAPSWTNPIPAPTLPFPGGTPGTLGELQSSPSLGAQFAGPGASTPPLQPSVGEQVVGAPQFMQPGMPGMPLAQPPAQSPVPSVQPEISAQSPGPTPQQAGQGEVNRYGQLIGGSRIGPRDMAVLAPLIRMQYQRALKGESGLGNYPYDQQQRIQQGKAVEPREIYQQRMKFEEKQGEQFLKDVSGYYETSRNSRQYRQSLAAMEAMTQGGVVSGAGIEVTRTLGGFVNWARTTAESLGIDPKKIAQFLPKEASALETEAGKIAAIEGIHKGLVLARAGSLSRGFSEGDRVYVDAQQPGLHMTGPAREATIKMLDAIAQREQVNADIATQYIDYTGKWGLPRTTGGLEKEIQKWNDAHPLFRYKDSKGEWQLTDLGRELQSGLRPKVNENTPTLREVLGNLATEAGKSMRLQGQALGPLGGQSISDAVSNYIDKVRRNDPILGPLIERFSAPQQQQNPYSLQELLKERERRRKGG